MYFVTTKILSVSKIHLGLAYSLAYKRAIIKEEIFLFEKNKLLSSNHFYICRQHALVMGRTSMCCQSCSAHLHTLIGQNHQIQEFFSCYYVLLPRLYFFFDLPHSLNFFACLFFSNQKCCCIIIGNLILQELHPTLNLEN